MKTKILLSVFLAFAFLLSNGQTDIIPKTENSAGYTIPDHIKSRKAYKRAEWFFQQRAFPYDTIPVVNYRQEMTKEIRKVKNRASAGTANLDWSSIGPTGVEYSWVPEWGLVSGRVRSLAVHPTDPSIIYIGASRGGIWKTNDGGQNWQDIGHDLESLSFGAIAIDPNNPETIYAGSGVAILLENFTTYAGNGLYKSTDGGATWTVITHGFGTTTFFNDLIVSPYNSNIIFASLGGGNVFTGYEMSNEGVWKSMDGGNTWTRTLDVLDAADIAFHPTDPNIVYAAAGGYFSPLSGFYISNDLGDSWETSNNGLTLPPSGGRMQFDISQSDPGIIYAVIYDLNYNPDQGITRAYKSLNGGESWGPISTGTNLGGYHGNAWHDQGWYDLCIAVDPNDPDHVLIGNIELHRTVDGENFEPVRPYGNGNDCWGSLAHIDYHQLTFAPSNPDWLFIACDGGIYRSMDKGYIATSLNEGLETLQFYRIGSHPDNSEIMIGGMQDNATAITNDGGENWNWVTGGDGMECFFSPNPDTVYTSNQNGRLYRSINGGASFSFLINIYGAWITPFLMHPNNHKIIYTADKRIRKSTNAGSSFQVISGLSNVAPSNISTMAQSQVNPNYMIFGTGTDHPHNDTVFIVKISTDEGANWTDVSANIPGESRWVSRVVTDPVDAHTMYVLRTGFSEANKVWKSTDLGMSWVNISGNLPNFPCSDLFIDPEDTDHLYLANDIGVYISTDGGTTWEYGSEGMPFVPAIDFDYVRIGDVKYLRVGTFGRSIYQTTIPLIGVGEPELSLSTKNEDVVMWSYPNPFSSEVTIEYKLAHAANISITIFNHLGHQVKIINQGHHQAGRHQYVWNTSGLPDGVYVVRLRAGKEVVAEKIVKMD